MTHPTATAAARKIRAQDLEAQDAMRQAKPATLAAAQAIKDIGSMYPADMAALAYTLHQHIERTHGLWIARNAVLCGLEDIQQECVGAMRIEAERNVAADWEKQQ